MMKSAAIALLLLAHPAYACSVDRKGDSVTVTDCEHVTVSKSMIDHLAQVKVRDATDVFLTASDTSCTVQMIDLKNIFAYQCSGMIISNSDVFRLVDVRVAHWKDVVFGDTVISSEKFQKEK